MPLPLGYTNFLDPLLLGLCRDLVCYGMTIDHDCYAFRPRRLAFAKISAGSFA